MAIYNITSQQLKGAGILNSFEIPTVGSFINTKSLNFGGVNERVDITHSLTTSQGSYSAWIKPDLTNERIFIMSDGGVYRTLVGLESRTDGTVRARLIISHQVKWALVTDNTVLNSSNWTHVALVHDGTEPKIYIDGVAVAQTFSTSTDKTLWWDDFSVTRSRIGARIAQNYSARYWKGVIDEVSIFTTALSASDVASIYGSGVPNDISSLSPLNWYRCGDGDTSPTLTDNGSGGNNGTMVNMDSGDIVEDVPS